jgi:predicted Zn-dependent protease
LFVIVFVLSNFRAFVILQLRVLRAFVVNCLPLRGPSDSVTGMSYRLFRLAVFAMVAVAASSAVADAPPAPLAEARRLFLTGKYAEALDAYVPGEKEHPVVAAIGKARCLTANGKLDEADEVLTAALVAQPQAAALHAELAQAAFARGDVKIAEQHVAAALAVDPKCRLARWIAAELLRTSGKLPEADAAYKWFVDDYNDTESFTDPDDLRYIGLGAAQYARWNRLSDQFTFLVNELFPSALELDKNYWPAKLESGLLFLEKYNESEAAKDLKAALALNPHSAEIHTAVARLAIENFGLEAARQSIDRALEIRPDYLSALLASADVHLANFEADEAIVVLERARKLNPIADETLGRLAAAYAVVDGWSDAHAQSARFKQIVEEVNARNPHCGEFYLALARTFDQTRRFPGAAQYYKLAAERMPQLTTARGELGMMLMRLGEEAEAKKLLDESFAVDPFNVRVSNMRKVLEVLDDYAVLETPHFVLKFDRVKEEIFARYVAKYLEEEVYPELTKQFGFEPEGKSLFEIFSRSRNTGGHGWFSARMVGLPYVGTVGACAGKMVALASPNDADHKFNWARVLKHEFVHVLNLQQSRFNIPHWYTEALAVESEGGVRPAEWNALLAERVPKGELYNLDNINLAFVRPKTSLNWQMAYCQAQLYAQYMRKTYGDDALARMLAAYRDNLSTRAALKRCFDVEQADFEQGYLDFVRKIAQDLSAAAPADEMAFSQLIRANKEKPDDLDAAARLAAAYVDRQQYPEARKLVDAVRQKSPQHPTASYVRARLHLVVGEEAEAEKLLDASLDRNRPDARALTLAASLKYKAGKLEEAEALYTLGREKFPYDPKWGKALAKIYLVTKNEAKLATALETLALADADDLVVRKKLAQIALAGGRFADARRWATESIYCDVLDADAHRMLAQACDGLNRPADALPEYETLVKLKTDDAEAWSSLARAARAAGKAEVADRALVRLKQIDPDHAALKAVK